VSACKVCDQRVPVGDELCEEDAVLWGASGEHKRYAAIPVTEPHRRLVALRDFVERVRAERQDRRSP
jgi:hypothetical protein